MSEIVKLAECRDYLESIFNVLQNEELTDTTDPQGVLIFGTLKLIDKYLEEFIEASAEAVH